MKCFMECMFRSIKKVSKVVFLDQKHLVFKASKLKCVLLC